MANNILTEISFYQVGRYCKNKQEHVWTIRSTYAKALGKVLVLNISNIDPDIKYYLGSAVN